MRQHSPAVMLNLLGDVWFDGGRQRRAAREPAWDEVLALPGANLHLYGKEEPRRRPQDGPRDLHRADAGSSAQAGRDCARSCTA